MTTILFLVLVAVALSLYGVRLLGVLEAAVTTVGGAGVRVLRDIGRTQLPRVRNAAIAVAAVTLILFAISAGLILWGVKIEEWRLLKESGASPEVLKRFELGLIGTLGSSLGTIGWFLFWIFAGLQVLRAVLRRPLVRRLGEQDVEFLRRGIWYYAGPVVMVLVVGLVIWRAKSIASFVISVTTEDISYLTATLSVAAGALVFGVWLVLFSRGAVAVAWAVGTVYDLVGGTLWWIGKAVTNVLAAVGIGEKLDRRVGARAELMSWADAATWPWVIIWFTVTAAIIPFPWKSTLFVMFPSAAFLILLYSIRRWRGWREFFSLTAFIITVGFFIPAWVVQLQLPLTTGLISDVSAAKLPVPRGAVGVSMRRLDSYLACGVFKLPSVPKYCARWKMDRVALALGAEGGSLDLPDLPDVQQQQPAPGAPARPDDDRTVDEPADE